MIAFGLTLLALAMWFVQGIGFLQWLAPSVRTPSLLGWVLAAWLGLVLQVVVLVNLYYLAPGLTIGQVAWPTTLLLAACSIALYVCTPRAKLVFDRESWILVPLVLAGTLLVLRPLVAHGSLGFYFSNNGEFANYAAMADVVQFHDAGTDTHGMSVVSREAVAGALAAVLGTLTGKSALWVIEPVGAAFAALGFASLGLLVRRITARLSPLACGAVWLVPAWAILSASSQCFFTLSFVSQYLNISLFFGGLLFLGYTRDVVAWRRLVPLGVLVGALACVYPEMLVPSTGLLFAYELAATEPSMRARGRAALHLLGALALGALLANRLGFTLVITRDGISGGGWDIYGPHHPVLPFVARLTGFTSTFALPHERSAFWPALATLVFVAGLIHAILRVRREPDALARGLYHLGWLFFVGVAGVFWVIGHHHLATNYIALKYLLGFGWLAYLLVAQAFARIVEQWPRAVVAIAAVMLVVVGGLAGPAIEFTRQLHRAEKEALFLEADAQKCRASLARRAHVSTDPALYIVGRFIASDHDLLAVDGRWPDGTGAQWTAGAPIVLVGEGRTLAQDAAVTQPYHPVCTGRGFTVLEAD